VAAILTGLYARNRRLVVEGASVVVAGRSIDSLNVANLRRRVNRSLLIQEVHHTARIRGEDLDMTLRYAGYCRAEKETAMEFSIDTDNNIPFADLECFAYDLQNDPGRKHKIRPMLVGGDGISKKIAVPFLESLGAHQPFSVLLKCSLPGCMKAGLEYYTSTLSFGQDRVRRCTVSLTFFGGRPAWVRAYECARFGRTKLLRDLRPVVENQEFSEYMDTAEQLEAQSARIYVFWRASSSGHGAQPVAPTQSQAPTAGDESSVISEHP